MKKSLFKRLLSLALVLTLFATVLAPTVSAYYEKEPPTEDVTKIDYEFILSKRIDAVSDPDSAVGDNWSYRGRGSSVANFEVSIEPGLIGNGSDAYLLADAKHYGDWVAVAINVSEAGYYDVNAVINLEVGGAVGAVYRLPDSYSNATQLKIHKFMTGTDADTVELRDSCKLGEIDHGYKIGGVTAEVANQQSVLSTQTLGRHKLSKGDNIFVFSVIRKSWNAGEDSASYRMRYQKLSLTAAEGYGKTASVLYTEEMMAIAQENIEKFDWAAQIQKGSKVNASKYLEKYNALYHRIMDEGVPRSSQLQMHGGDLENFCYYCGQDNRSNKWNIDPIGHEWKVQCRKCSLWFPSNDFKGFYEACIEKYGYFDVELAHKVDEERVAAGLKSNLVNELYPKMGEGWGVDDGYGFRVYQDGSYNKPYVPNDPTIDRSKTSLYVAHYGWQFWSTVPGYIKNLADAYIYTGDVAYGHAAAKLLTRIAEALVTYDSKGNYSPTDFHRPDVQQGWGQVLGRVNENAMMQVILRSLDAVWPVIADDEVLDYIANKTGIRRSVAQQHSFLRENILLEVYRDAYSGHYNGNFGMPQTTVGMAAIILDDFPMTDVMLKWVYQTGSWSNGKQIHSGGNLSAQLVNVSLRDGFGHESAPNYNIMHTNNLMSLAEVLTKYTGKNEYNLYENAKFAKMCAAHVSLTEVMNQTVQIADSSGVAALSFRGALGTADVAFKYLKDTPLAKQLAEFVYTNCLAGGGNLDYMHYDIFTKNPDTFKDDILALIGDGIEQKCEMLPAYGFSILREGETINVLTLRDIWMNYTQTDGHGHRDALNIGLAAFGINLSPDLGYPTATGTYPVRLQWESATISHNTVTVNGEYQKEIKETFDPYLFDDSDLVKVMGTDASKVYDETDIYSRTIAYIKVDAENSYAVDFFRVLGGNQHTYSFHAASHEALLYDGATLIPQLNYLGEYWGSYAGLNVPVGEDPDTIRDASYYDTYYPRGYTWLEKVRKTKYTCGEFTAEFKITDYNNTIPDNQNIYLRLTQVNDFTPSEIALCGGPVPNRTSSDKVFAYSDTLEYLLVHRKGEEGEKLDSLFTSVLQPYKETPYIKAVEPVSVRVVSGTPGQTDTAKAIKVIHENNRVDYVFYASNNSVTYRVNDLFNVRGSVAVYSVVESNKVSKDNYTELYRYVADGDIIVDYTEKVGAYTGVVTNFSKTYALENNYIDVAMRGANPSDLIGRYIYIQNDGVENAVYQITGAKAISGGYRLDIGTVTTIRAYADAYNFDAGYVYNIEAGQSFRIPMSYTSIRHEHFGGIADCGSPEYCVCGTAHGEVNPDNHVGFTIYRNKHSASATSAGYSGDMVCAACGFTYVKGASVAPTGDETPLVAAAIIFIASTMSLGALYIFHWKKGKKNGVHQ